MGGIICTVRFKPARSIHLKKMNFLLKADLQKNEVGD